jgi:hypothetical protein
MPEPNIFQPMNAQQAERQRLRWGLEYAKDQYEAALDMVQSFLRDHDVGIRPLSLRELTMCRFAVKRYRESITNVERVMLYMLEPEHPDAPIAEYESEKWFHEVHPELQRRQKELCDGCRAELALPRDPVLSLPAREVWKGSLRDFCQWAIAEKNAGRIRAPSDRQAVMISAKQFDLMDKKTGQRKPLNGKTAWESWRNKTQYETPPKNSKG